ncbi:hypothetical protein, conserved [Babesia bigemina]|uniref:Uncharacterized protein n=1 Tax=Babesia bigemina TaxID=5866 RepID=A0A061D6K0_BABBI|nr:hypothetical protein, conserved [Babesia bigemina]CDR94569.1 hypothetical protein, conserved [Babesia bigemina]|eukprot:XP_012766755.1 hypothetical protein, conserved [Babesia bigemina]
MMRRASVGDAPSGAFLATASLDDIVAHSLEYEPEKDVSDLKDSENVSLVYHFLRHIWTSMTDASVYEPREGLAGDSDVIPFLHSDEWRQRVSKRILDLLSHFREDPSEDGTGGGEQTLPALRNVAQGHLTTCFKILSSYLLVGCQSSVTCTPRQSRRVGKSVLPKFSSAAMCLVDVYMYMVPIAIDLSSFLDLLTDLVKGLPVESAKVLSDFLYCRVSFLRTSFEQLEASATNARLVQTAGAKMIGLVRVLEGVLGESADGDVPVHIFNLRLTLTSCLPISHLGVCNRQSLSQEFTPVSKVTADEWTDIVTMSLRKRSYGISQFEISNYEAVAAISAPPSSTSGQLFDLKSLAGRGEPRVEVADTSQRIPSYAVYVHYCDVLNFVFNPFIIVEETQDYMDDLQTAFAAVTGYIISLIEKPQPPDTSLSWIIPLTSSVPAFIARSTSVKFWTSFLCASSFALQSLKISHKRTAPTESVYSLLREKSAASLDAIEKTLNQCISKIGGLAVTLERLLCREKEWVLWKQRGCTTDVLEPVTGDVFTFPEDVPSSDGESEEGEMVDFLDVLSQLESVSPVDENGLPEVGANFIIDVKDLCLNRQATAWYLEKRATDKPASSAHEKLYQMLDDYMEKMRMDADPAQGIEEAERSKHDPLFRFRFNRLFANRYVHKYMDLSNEDVTSGSIDCLVESLRSYDRMGKKVRKRAGT